MERTPDVCIRTTTVSTVLSPFVPPICPSISLPRVYNTDTYVCAYMLRVRVCMCIHTTCVYSVPVRPATRSPSTTNTARTIVVSTMVRYTGCSVQFETSSNRALTHTERAKWKRSSKGKNDGAVKYGSVLVFELSRTR